MELLDIYDDNGNKTGRIIERGDKILLTGFGGGMTWGTMLITW